MTYSGPLRGMHAQRARIAASLHSRGRSVYRVCAHARVLAFVRRETIVSACTVVVGGAAIDHCEHSVQVVATVAENSSTVKCWILCRFSTRCCKDYSCSDNDGPIAKNGCAFDSCGAQLGVYSWQHLTQQHNLHIYPAMPLTVFQLALAEMAWSRTFQELIASGLLSYDCVVGCLLVGGGRAAMLVALSLAQDVTQFLLDWCALRWMPNIVGPRRRTLCVLSTVHWKCLLCYASMEVSQDAWIGRCHEI